MKRKSLARLLFAVVLLLVATLPGLSSAASMSADAVAAAPARQACGYSAGGVDTAYDDAEANANRNCIALGCKGAVVTVAYQPWVDEQGYTHVCVGYYCDCTVVAAAE
jgi:hypothetical protein